MKPAAQCINFYRQRQRFSPEQAVGSAAARYNVGHIHTGERPRKAWMQLTGRLLAELKPTVLETLRARLRENFLLRWTVANLAGWTVGLLVGAWSSVTPLLCLGVLLAAVSVGLAQWWALRGELPVSRDRWIGWTLAGAAGGLPGVALAALVALFNWNIGLALAGAALGAGIGTAQSFLLNQLFSRAGWWIAANAGAGALCALLTLLPVVRGLPLGLLAGAAMAGRAGCGGGAKIG